MPETPENNSNKSNIIKLIVVLLSIAFIIIAGVIAMQREKRNAPPEEKTVDTEPSEETIDSENAVFLAMIPTVEVPVSYNGLTRSECEAAVKDGSKILLKTKNGSSVYVNNYHDDKLVKSSAKTAEDLNAWLYSGAAVFDVDTELVADMYFDALKDYMENLKKNQKLSLSGFLKNEGLTADEFMEGEIHSAYRYFCDLEMGEAVLNDTIGDVTEEEIAELASSEGYDSVENFINEYGRSSILYYLRPQRILKYVEQRMEEVK